MADTVYAVANTSEDLLKAYEMIMRYLSESPKTKIRAVHSAIPAAALAICKVDKEVMIAANAATHMYKRDDALRVFLSSTLPRDAHLLCNSKLIAVMYNSSDDCIATKRNFRSRDELIHIICNSVQQPLNTTWQPDTDLKSAWGYQHLDALASKLAHIVYPTRPHISSLPHMQLDSSIASNLINFK